MKKFIAWAAPVVLAAAIALPAHAADRQPTADELAKIEAALKAEGFSSWGRIELDDDRVWEVDDARHSDGNKYDLELARDTLAIVDRDRD